MPKPANRFESLIYPHKFVLPGTDIAFDIVPSLEQVIRISKILSSEQNKDGGVESQANSLCEALCLLVGATDEEKVALSCYMARGVVGGDVHKFIADIANAIQDALGFPAAAEGDADELRGKSAETQLSKV